MLRKVGFTSEPILKAHRYVVEVCFRVVPKVGGSYTRTKYFYCINLKEVRQVCNKAKKGSWMKVHRATHNFIQGYAKE